VTSTRWLPPTPIGLGSLRLAEARALPRPLAAVSLACLSPSRFHLPVLLGSIPVTGLLRYYEDSDAFRARLFAPLSGMNSASPPGSRSPLHLTPTSNHPVSNHLRALLPLSGCLCGGLPEVAPLCRWAQVLVLRPSLVGSPCSETESSSTWSCLRAGCSLPVAPHPASQRRSYFQLRRVSFPSDQDFHPTVGVRSWAH
jgi:hypothetical protein